MQVTHSLAHMEGKLLGQSTMLYKPRPNLQFAIVKKDFKRKKEKKKRSWKQLSLSPNDLTHTYCLGRQN